MPRQVMALGIGRTAPSSGMTYRQQVIDCLVICLAAKEHPISDGVSFIVTAAKAVLVCRAYQLATQGVLIERILHPT